MLSTGNTTKVSCRDYDRVSQFGWYETGPRNRKYIMGRINGRELSMHRFILLGERYSEKQVDHRNGDRFDNCRTNLRLVTNAQNCQNRRVRSKSSGYKGVTRYANQRRPWVARIRFQGKLRYLGHHSTPQKAAQAYDIAAKRLFGEFAHFNFPLNFHSMKNTTERAGNASRTAQKLKPLSLPSKTIKRAGSSLYA